jgi:hypothetical protein
LRTLHPQFLAHLIRSNAYREKLEQLGHALVGDYASPEKAGVDQRTNEPIVSFIHFSSSFFRRGDRQLWTPMHRSSEEAVVCRSSAPLCV